ncbi:cathepsin S-like [Condylostylus longicornis]|uniref:cathepsin S-like n=1 Tax=Condylostylus longicornis TaxID=2530218 RepID=UPI00244DEAE0|nr:cathepsin S-like [Condylostylus longicornis]
MLYINLILLFYLLHLNWMLLLKGENIENKWYQYCNNFNKNYSLPFEDTIRQNIFKETINFIKKHNKKFQNGLVSYDLGINHLSDLTNYEYFQKYLQYYYYHNINNKNNKNNLYDKILKRKIQQRKIKFHQMLPRSDIPETINWLKYGYKNKIIDQENCKNSYILASISTMEAHYYIKYKKLIQLSTNNILKCIKRLGNFDCNIGGSIERIYQYGMLFGIPLENNIEKNNITCRNERKSFYIKKIYISIPMINSTTTETTTTRLPSSSLSPSSSSLSSIANALVESKLYDMNIIQNENIIINSNEIAMQQAIAFYGPVTAAIDARLDTFRLYRGGLYYDSNCSSTLNETNHFVTVIGYGKMNDNTGKEYWLIRNSFGNDWGVNGYMFLIRNLNNHCGIGTYFIYPEVA